ncbi:MAG: DUF177 domain-containing protein [Gracilimonas sp.]|jgi:uncharacterized metal-binding protein YceD (DUF177 family)|nr:DUF177 domain-containing protein [Gracilimonas sp.]
MFRFKIFELPEEQSEKSLELKVDAIDLGDQVTFAGGMLNIQFYRTPQFIRAQFEVNATVELTCDRSLDNFDHELDQQYEVLFKTDDIEESADENGAVRNIDHTSQEIDLEQDVRDTILLNLPAKKLHPRYLDEDGNPKEVLHKKFGDIPEDDEDQIDPRWEKLKDLKD